MTNVEIIKDYKRANNIPENEELNTIFVWNKLGFKVKKGEKSKHKIVIYKQIVEVTKSENEEVRTKRMIPKKAYFFTKEQVEKRGD